MLNNKACVYEFKWSLSIIFMACGLLFCCLAPSIHQCSHSTALVLAIAFGIVTLFLKSGLGFQASLLEQYCFQCEPHVWPNSPSKTNFQAGYGFWNINGQQSKCLSRKTLWGMWSLAVDSTFFGLLLFQGIICPLIAMPLRTVGTYLTFVLRMKTLHEWSDNKEDSSFPPHNVLTTKNYPV